MSILERILKTVVLDEATITEKVALSKTAFKIRLQSNSIKKISFIPGAFLRLGIGIGKEELPMKDKIRSYSIWNIDGTKGYLDLAIATHSKGIGSQWAKDCKEGDTVYYKFKKGNFIADDAADSYLMIGDLSSLSHLYMINRALGAEKQVASIIYNTPKEEFFPDIDGRYPFEIKELLQNSNEEISAKIKDIAPTLKGKKMVYIAGDSRVCIAAHSFFKNELGWEPKQIKTKPFWNPDKKGLE
ncbi:SIP domain-containing protein [Cellulophaga sp. L1A9]|uniref:SIP domain-containing protein n=1 Tax=Cellulophaga sp. L1A9 TaxID=2686362 RepID=UPI00131AD2BC|nr:SIP domain-containing protein [Cellulophaga sp. L1A9]